MNTRRTPFLLVTSVFLTSLLLASPWVFAEVPHRIRYQGQAVDASGVPLEGPYDLTFRLYTSETEADTDCADELGACVWQETHEDETLTNGHFTVLLGQFTLLDSVDWSQSLWLSIQVGIDPELAPRVQLTSVPLALRAEIADGLSQAIEPTLISPQGAGSGLDADSVDGYHATGLLDRANHTGTQPSSTITGTFAPSVLSPQGSGSGLDADLVDGYHAATLLSRSSHTGTQSPSTISPQGPGSGLNADLFDGRDSSSFGDATAANQVTIMDRIGTSGDAPSLSPSTLFSGVKGVIQQVDNAYSACFTMLPYDSNPSDGATSCGNPSCPGGWSQVTTFNYVIIDDTDGSEYPNSEYPNNETRVCTAVACCLGR